MARVTTDTTKLLKSLESAWSEAEAKAVEFSTIPDGTYKGYLRSSVVELSKGGNLQVHWTLQVADGEYKNRKVHKFDRLESEDNLGWLKGTMTTLGMKIPTKLTNLPKALNMFFEENGDSVLIDFTVRTKDEFTNVYINGKTDSTPTGKNEDDNFEDDINTEASSSEDDIPF